ncbi:NAD(P)-binding domain-containing protein [Tessaracoccus sp. MC1627]|uniref:flavin-containing monooxygenase n=1 Tax=Tessaracoccus sp. MC1627 TaxID=2760312 RepID=UPI0015FFDECA|nr:NAD(P)/FAD-dependent oxidoreductase [Tessaracoccus sp. MC1627]MBB1513755.1 NAD(P)-binding domain-containing protein [Tessaracoccus sp. MC1627]
MGRDEVEVVIVGAGQAGLATSHELTGLGIEHVLLERADAVGSSWASRWDSFCLVTPNSRNTLPGGEYRGDRPEGFLTRDEVVQYLADYATSIAASIRTGVNITSLVPGPDGRLTLTTGGGDTIVSREVVVATGGLRDAFRPSWATQIQPVPVLDASQYRNPDSIPPGGVLVVGSGQTGCQLAEELITTGRRIVQACGRAPWMPRRIEGRDTFDWIAETAFMDQSLDDVPGGPAARFMSNPQATGRDGGHDLTTRTLQTRGVELAGHVTGIEDGVVVFGGDLAACVAFGDARWADLRDAISRSQIKRGRPVPSMPDVEPFDSHDELDHLRLDEIGSVLLTTGFRPSYRAWIDIPEGFDPMGLPLQVDGRSTIVPGVSFVGVPFMRTRSSQLLMGVGRDAAVVARGIQKSLAAA